MKSRIETYLELAAKLCTDSSATAIHDFRVASRYLMAIEPLLRNVTDTRHWRKPLKRHLKSLTRLRDLHVFRSRFSDHPELSVVLDAAIADELANSRGIRSRICSGKLSKQLCKSYHNFCSSGLKKTAVDALVYKTWMKHWSALDKKLKSIDYDDPVSIHQLRISFKPFRYITSFLHESELLPVASFEGFKYWQDIMGQINDLEVVCGWLEKQAVDKNRVIQLDEEAALLRQKLKVEGPALRNFIDTINTNVISRLGS